jgi:hypothetical protein
MVDLSDEGERRMTKLDATGIPTAMCPNCGSSWLNVPVMFDPVTYEIAAWGTEASCFSCGTLVTACCPVDALSGRGAE